MKKVIKLLFKLILGYFLFAIGIVLTVQANLGLSPWDVFHQGISKNLNITMGNASIAVGFIIVMLDSLLGEKVGWGTVLNMIFIGVFMDVLMLNNLIPTFESFPAKLIMMVVGMAFMGVGTYWYISAGLGSGPRDGLMVALTKRTGKSVRLIRNSIEVGALIIGYILGGYVGLGTLIMALTVGYFVQFSFKIFKFDVNKINHRFIDDDIRFLKGKLGSKSEEVDVN